MMIDFRRAFWVRCAGEKPTLIWYDFGRFSMAGMAFAMHLKMKQNELRAYIDSRARELAESGKHLNWLSIETHLRLVEGLTEARAILDREWYRDYLDGLCVAAQRRVKAARDAQLPPNSAE
jgi:hypothetical protein